jgi:hypothetical protein
MIDKALDWIEQNYLRATLIALAVMVLLLGLTFASLAKAATLTGAFTLPTQYEDGTALPQASIKHIRVEAGTCSQSAQFYAAEGSQLVAPPATAWSITVPRAFGKFCVRAQTETVDGTLSVWTGTATKTIAEPQPKPPVLLTTGGWVWEVKTNDGLRFVGTIDAGKACAGLAPQFEPDLFPVERSDVRLEKRPRAGATLLAQCSAG